MSTLARRSPRVLVVAAVSTTAWVGSTAGASAAPRCDPATADCTSPLTNFAEFFSKTTTTEKTTETTTETTEKTTETVSNKVTVIRKPVVAAEPEVVATKLVEEERPKGPPLAIAEFCRVATSDQPLAVMATRAMSRFLGLQLVGTESMPAVLTRDGTVYRCAVDDAEPPTLTLETTRTYEPLDAAPETTTEATTKTTKTVRTLNTAVAPSTSTEVAATRAPAATPGGVNVDAVEVEDGTAVAPEQHEVSAPATVVTEALPKTGGDGALLTMLGLALIASGAAVRTVARD